MTVGRVTRLAIDGGEPVRRSLLPYARQQIDERDVEAVVEALRSDWLTTGPHVRAFEERLEAVTGARHAVAFSSGTAALHGATVAAGFGAGDEAITTPMTFVATANAVLYAGATVRFADVDEATLLIDPDPVAAAVSRSTRALIAVDYAGQPADYARLRASLADAGATGAVVIADASHSLGATRDGVPVGRLADVTVLSLHPAKIVTTGEGGAVLTDRDELAARRDWRYDMVELGFNYRLTDIGSALGLAQLDRLPEFLRRRQEIAARYLAALEGHWAVQLPVVEPAATSAWHLFVVQLRLDRLTVDRGAIYRAMRAEGIGVNVHYIPVHRHSYYRDRLPGLDGTLPNAEAAYERLLTLPLFAGLSDADVEDVVAALDKVSTAYRA
jgi:perosamine synthetase